MDTVDLHESSHLDKHEAIKEGMVITIEPGVYVPPLSEFPKAFHNIGIRIEDEVLVGEELPEVLSVNAPKEVREAASQRSIRLTCILSIDCRYRGVVPRAIGAYSFVVDIHIGVPPYVRLMVLFYMPNSSCDARVAELCDVRQ